MTAAIRRILPDTPVLNAVERATVEFGDGYALGYETGYHVGYAHAENDMDRAWQPVAKSVRERANSAKYAELVAARAHVTNEPCGSPRCRGCSACVRALAVKSNRAKYGTDDFPGVAA